MVDVVYAWSVSKKGRPKCSITITSAPSNGRPTPKLAHNWTEGRGVRKGKGVRGSGMEGVREGIDSIVLPL